MNRLRKKGPTLQLLQNALAPSQKCILDKALPELIRCLCDCTRNILQENVTLSRHYKQKLQQHKIKLRKLADCKVALKTKNQLAQTRGFLPLLLSALAPVITGVAGSLIK